MADKIVTLKDKNDNNLYPVAGALFANTVTTSSIQDGAVSPSKIDWALFDKRFELLTVASETTNLTLNGSQLEVNQIGSAVTVTNSTDQPMTYFVSATVNARKSSGSAYVEFVVRIFDGATNTGDATNLAYTEVTNWQAITMNGLVTIPANSSRTLKLYGIVPTGTTGEVMRSYQNYPSRAPHMTIFRVG